MKKLTIIVLAILMLGACASKQAIKDKTSEKIDNKIEKDKEYF